MLENSEILIMPWSDACLQLDPPDDSAQVRRIVDPVAGACLGFVSAVHGRARWLSGCRRLTLRVCEFPDASLVMTLHRPWGFLRMWQVLDADERRIGSFYRRHLYDGLGYLFAGHEEGTVSGGKFLMPPSVELGSWAALADGVIRLKFNPIPECSPFARMILLGKVLSERPFLPKVAV